LVLVSTATSTSARPLGSRNSTTLVPNNDWGCGAVIQSAGAANEKRPCGSVQVTRSLAAGLATGVAAAGDVGVTAGGVGVTARGVGVMAGGVGVTAAGAAGSVGKASVGNGWPGAAVASAAGVRQCSSACLSAWS